MKHLIHGALWWKFDFHNHTPASKDFGKGDAAYKNISAKDWLLMYMAQEIDCVAITDHNTGDWIDILKRALWELEEEKAKGYRKLWLFPGVEISASGNTHLLAIFDPTADTKKVHALLGSVGFPSDQFGTSDAVTNKTVVEVIQKIHLAGGIAVPAHVDGPCGLFTKEDGNTLKQSLAVEGLLAIEVIDPSVLKPDIYVQSKLSLSEIIGSDSHIADQVGSRFTWVKMGSPSLDALKLALHDGDDGLIRHEVTKNDPNQILSRYFIKSVSIVNGYKAGNGTPMSAEFSPWLTSIIGGRGSGESSVLNYLRIAMNRIDEMPEEIDGEFRKFYSLGKKDSPGMLRPATEIVVEIVKDAKVHRIRWHNYLHTLEEREHDSSTWSAVTSVSNIKELFPIQIFSQKELYSVTGDPQKLLELIDSQFDKALWSAEQNQLIERWLAGRAARRQLHNAISEEPNISAQLKQTNNRIALFESSEFKEILEKFNKLSETSRFFSDISTDVSSFIDQLLIFENAVPRVEIPENILDTITGDSLEFVETLNAALQSAKAKLLEAEEVLRPYGENLDALTKTLNWFVDYMNAKSSYDGIADQIGELGTDTYETLLQRRAGISEKLANISSQKEQLSKLQNELRALYVDIIGKEQDLRRMRREVIGRWKTIDDQKNPFLTIELHSMGDPEGAVATFRELLRKTGGEFANDLYVYDDEKRTSKGLIAEIINEPEASRWAKRDAAILEFLSASEQDKKNLDMRLAKHLDYLKATTPEDIDRILIWVPEDKLVLKFRKQGKEEDIQSGSAGERTAGMLGLLLAINDNPLIIDQPEDDLDSKLISNFVVDGLKKLKQSRQLVVVTHNPNITVNANSDNVVHMEFVSGQIVVSANNALQDKGIRTAVCEVMEGGRDALDRRYYRISKALSG